MIKKAFILLTLLFLSHFSVAAPSEPVTHSHSGRSHTHPLPAQGVGHRHGVGQIGIVSGGVKPSGSISSSVQYPNQPSGAISKEPNATRSPWRIPAIESFPSVKKEPTKQTPPKRAPIIISNNTSLSTQFRLSKGDASCRRGEADCNVCASNVQQQFYKAGSGQFGWEKKSWGFSWVKPYPPFNKRPVDIFNGDPVLPLRIPNKHVQGFTRTNSARYPYVGSHSHKKKGGIFIVEKHRNGSNYLSSLIPSKTAHPSGVQVMGKYLMYGDKGRVHFKDINNPNNNKTLSFPVSKANFGGGLGAIRLSRNNYLLITSGPGGKDSRPRYNRFYHLRGKNSRPELIRYLGQSAVTKAPSWPDLFRFSENLSVVTECGTGDIYTIHSGGEEVGIKAMKGKGFWRLSKLIENNGKLKLAPINAFSKGQNMSSCSILAASSVHVNPQHKMEFYCHGYAKNRNGSDFNVLGKSNRTQDSFQFKVGIAR